MPINSIETATAYTDELDKLFVQKSVTGFFADNAFGAKFVGAKTVVVPDIDFQGLNNYDRDTGFNRGAVTVSHSSYTMSMDRARSLQIDREDMDETGIASLAGKVLGEYVRTKVVPECDAYVLSKLTRQALATGSVFGLDGTDNIYSTFNSMVRSVRDAVGYDEELVAFVGGEVYTALQNSNEISRMLSVGDFKQGEINTTVQSLNGTAIIPVRNDLMYSEFSFRNDSTGGFIPATDAQLVNIIVCPKKCAQLVRKEEQMRVFAPEQNPNADAYKFDYRIYYDLFVRKGFEKAISVMTSPNVTYTIMQGGDTIPHGTEGYRMGVMMTGPADANDVCTYKWYSCDQNGNYGQLMKGYVYNMIDIPSNQSIGQYHYYCEMTYNPYVTVKSGVLHLEIVEAS